MRILTYLLVLLLLASAALALVRCRDATEVAAIGSSIDTTFMLGEVVPDFEFADLNGRRTSLREYARRGPVILVARDALCPVSRRYGPTTSRFESEYETRGVKFLYVNVSPLDTEEQMLDDAERYRLSGAYTHDPDWRVAGLLGMITTGEVFLLDRELRLRYRGAIDDQYGIRFTKPEPRRHYLRSALDQLLAGQSITTPATLPEGCYLASEVRHTVEESEEQGQ